MTENGSGSQSTADMETSAPPLFVNGDSPTPGWVLPVALAGAGVLCLALGLCAFLGSKRQRGGSKLAESDVQYSAQDDGDSGYHMPGEPAIIYGGTPGALEYDAPPSALGGSYSQPPPRSSEYGSAPSAVNQNYDAVPPEKLD